MAESSLISHLRSCVPTSLTTEQYSALIYHTDEVLFEDQFACLKIEEVQQTLMTLIVRVENAEEDNQQELENTMIIWIKQFCQVPEGQEVNLLWRSLRIYVLLFSEWLNAQPTIPKNALRISLKKLIAFDISQLLHNRPPDHEFTSAMMCLLFPLLRHGEDIRELATWLKNVDINDDMWKTWGSRLVHILVKYQKEDSGQMIKGVLELLREREELAKFILSEVAAAALKAENSEKMTAICKLIEDFAHDFPSLFFNEFALLMGLLNSESHALRSCLVNAIESYIIYLNSDQCNVKADTKVDRVKRLFYILEQRTRDRQGEARQKVLDSLFSLIQSQCLPCEEFLTCLSIAKERLLDTQARVRKSAGKLLFALISNNLLERKQKLKSEKELMEQMLRNKEMLERPGKKGRKIDSGKVKIRMEQESLQKYLKMLNDFKECTRLLFRLLDSSAVGDVTISIENLLLLQYFGLYEARYATARILQYIWQGRDTAKKDILHGFHGVYTNTETRSFEDGFAALVELYAQLTPGERSSLEEVLKELWREKILNEDYYGLLKQEFIKKPEVSTAFFLRCGCIPMKNSFLQFYDTMAKCAKKETGSWRLMEELITATAVIGPNGYETQAFMVAATKKLLDSSIPLLPSWFRCAEELIRTLTRIEKNPLPMFQSILIISMKPLMGSQYQESDMAKAIFLAGEIAVKVAVVIDNLKSTLQSQEREKPSSEMDQISGIQEAEVTEKIEELKHIRSNSLLNGNLLQHFQPLISRVLQHAKECNPLTVMAAALGMCRFMCVSADYCQRAIEPFIFLLQDHSMPHSLRCNLVVAFGDLVQIWPNIVEQYTDYLFVTLKDREVEVRRKAMLVITHLVRSDMIKLKTQAANILLTLLDEDPTCSNLAMLFFKETKPRKQRMLVNSVPEALSRLAENKKISPDGFVKMADTVIPLVKTQKVQASFIDHLCQKLHHEDRRSTELLCYCISKAARSETAIRKLLDDVSTWQLLVLENAEIKKMFEESLEASSAGKESSGVFDEFRTRLNLSAIERPRKTPSHALKES